MSSLPLSSRLLQHHRSSAGRMGKQTFTKKLKKAAKKKLAIRTEARAIKKSDVSHKSRATG